MSLRQSVHCNRRPNEDIMKFLILALCVACAAANSVEQAAQVLRSDFQQSPEGEFQYNYETENGIAGVAHGVVKALGKDEFALNVEGSNSYKSPEGEIIQLSYVANENGFQPVGAHLPTTPAPQPIPDYILRSLEYIKAHPYVEKP